MGASDRIVRSFAPAPAPMHERRPQRDVTHGLARVDDYAWMRAPNWKAALADPRKLLIATVTA